MVDRALAQEATAAPSEPAATAAPTASGRAWVEPRVYEGARGGAWHNPAAEWLAREPTGSPHFGVLLEGGVIVFNFTNDFQTVVPSASVVLFAFLDVTLDRDETFRVGIYGDFTQLGGAVHPSDPHVTRLSGGGSVGVRALFGIDLVEHLVFRAGVEGGLVFPDGEFGGSALGRFELAWRLLEGRNLEIAVAAIGGLRYGATQYDCFSGCVGGVSVIPHSRTGGLVVPGLTVSVAWVFE